MTLLVAELLQLVAIFESLDPCNLQQRRCFICKCLEIKASSSRPTATRGRFLRALVAGSRGSCSSCCKFCSSLFL
jgi:hypothetical protein